MRQNRFLAFAAAMLAACSASAAITNRTTLPTSDYVQSGLILHLDGINNTGTGRHDYTTNGWASLVGGIYASFRTNVTTAASDDNRWNTVMNVPADYKSHLYGESRWLDDGYYFNGATYAKMESAIKNLTNYTIQVVCDVNTSTLQARYDATKGNDTTSINWPAFVGAVADKDYCNIYYNCINDEKRVNTKVNDKNFGLYIPQNDWNNHYVTAWYDGSNASLFDSDSLGETQSKNSMTTGVRTLTFGVSYASATYGKWRRTLVGTIKSIRIYDRALSNAELATNRTLDEARFFGNIPVTNVVVATNIKGVEGNEASGAYAFDAAGHTFTAPYLATNSLDGTTYICWGYTLETWDDSDWGTPVFTKGSLSAPLSDTSSKVRLTWQWLPCTVNDGLLSFDRFSSEDYSSDNLILHFDGLDNAGVGNHSASATTWKNLGSAGGDATFIPADTSAWRTDGYRFEGACYATVSPKITLDKSVTVQILADAKTNQMQSVSYATFIGATNKTGDACNIYYHTVNKQITFKNAPGDGAQNAPLVANSWNGGYINAVRDNDKNYIFTGTSRPVSGVKAGKDIGNVQFYLGSAVMGDGNGLDARYMKGTINSIRLYDRALSDFEFERNRAIDQMRFFGHIPVTNVVVATSIEGVEGNEASGVYALASGGHTFTAPYRKTVDGKEYICWGYTLETWDGSDWGAPVATTGSRSVTLSDTSAKVRLTWQWLPCTVNDGLLSFSSEAYSTNNLLLNFDGIDNAGVGKHDSSTNAWTNLGSVGGYATFTNVSDEAIASAWQADGYYFGGRSYATLSRQVHLEKDITIQILTDTTTNDLKHVPYATFIGATNAYYDACNVYYRKGTETDPADWKNLIRFKNYEYDSNYADMSAETWDNHYICAIRKGAEPKSTNYIFSTTSIPSTGRETGTGAIGDVQFWLGSATVTNSSSGFADRYMKGTIKSIRLYDRVLSDSELARNRVIDEVRFFGDVVISTDIVGVDGDEAAGIYAIAEGSSHTFTAPREKTVDGVTYLCTGYKIETWNGSAWSAPVSHTGERAVTRLSGSQRVRIEWQWLPSTDGLVGCRGTDYVGDGLLLNFDGIDNAGVGRHDSSADAWTNLGSKGGNAPFTHDADDGSGWLSDGYRFGGRSYATVSEKVDLDKTVTIQILSDVTTNDLKEVNWATFIGSTNVIWSYDACSVYYHSSNDCLRFKSSNDPILAYTGRSAWTNGYINAVRDHDVIYMPNAARNTKSGFKSMGNDVQFWLGSAYGPEKNNGDGNWGFNWRYMKGTIKSIRLYDRALSDRELAQNRALDEVRFFGSLSVTNVVVATSIEGVEGEEVSGAYALVDGGHEFTAPAMKTVDGTTYMCWGYTLETWNGSSWGPPALSNGSRSVTLSDTNSTVRLMWQWLPCSEKDGLLSFSSEVYSSASSLLLHFDGIDNDGVGIHNPSALAWKNLGSAAGDAPFTHATSDGSEWRADGYYFGSNTFATVSEIINLQKIVTIQILSDVDTNNLKKVKWPMFIGATNAAAADACNVYYLNDQDSNLVRFKNCNNKDGSANTLKGTWNGGYINAVRATDKNYVFSGAELPASGTNTDADAIGDVQFWIGSADGSNNGFGDRYLTGTIKSIRLYNTVLSDFVLARNRVIDDVRFFGALPITNVIVATAVEGVEGNEPSGPYAIAEGRSHVFSAPATERVTGGTTYACWGYTIENWNGSAWGAPATHSGDLSVSISASSSLVRITWLWEEVPGTATDGIITYSTSDYVGTSGDGLISHWDAINNAGASVAHNPNATVWTDLVGGNHLTLTNNCSEWRRGSAFYMDTITNRKAAAVGSAKADTYRTIEVAYLNTTRNGRILFYGGDTSRYVVFDYEKVTGSVTNKFAPPTSWVYFDGSEKTTTGDMTQCADVNSYEPTHLVATYNAGGSSGAVNGIYVDGVKQPSDGHRMFNTWGANSGSVVSLGERSADTPGAKDYGWAGEVYAIRLYDRELTAAEIARNKVIDEARFFSHIPVTNVVVASAVCGIGGNEPNGAYALATGGHTFTAPSETNITWRINGIAYTDSYSCTGYTLEKWDGSAWVDKTTSSLRSCLLDGTTEKVRLTWQWSHTAGPGYDGVIDKYATDGLVLHLDGVRNAGAELPHDGESAYWTDLATKGGEARFVAGEGCGWKGDGYFFDGTDKASYAMVNGKRALAGSYTIQSVTYFDPYASFRRDTAWPTIVGTTYTNDWFTFYCNHDSVNWPQARFKVHNVKSGFELTTWGGKYLTGLVDADESWVALFEEATPTSFKSANAFWPGSQIFTIGSGDGIEGYESHKLTGTIKSVRIYDRRLTDAELQQNRKVDEARFFRSRPSADAGELIVDTEVEGLEGDLPCGAYTPVNNAVFNANSAALHTNETDGAVYQLCGYKLETWNGSEWSAPTEYGSHTYNANVSTDSKRLTWRWELKSRLTKLDFDVGDYVQDGLYLNFDGIRNAGADAPHSTNTVTWVNLGSGGPDLDATFDYAKDGFVGDGWADDGYNFVYGGKFATLGANPAFNCFVTVEIVCVAPTNDTEFSNHYPTLFGAEEDLLNIYYFRDEHRLYVKAFNSDAPAPGGPERTSPGYKAPGGRMSLSANSWERGYANVLWCARKYQIYQTAVPGTSSNNWSGTCHYNLNRFSGKPFYIGGVNSGNSSDVDKRRFQGKIQAIRVYNRALTDEELAHNRMVDEARFKGHSPAGTNVVIATRYSARNGGESEGESLNVGVGYYKVEGSDAYTFASTEVKNSAGALVPTAGYFLERMQGDGSWGPKTWHWGTSFDYSASSGNIYRITWGIREGLFILWNGGE